MYPLSERLARLRENAAHAKPHSKVIQGQREYYYVTGAADAAAACKGKNAMLTAAATAAVIRGFHTMIEEDEIIVGHNYGAEEFIGHLPPEEMRALLADSLFSQAEIDRYFSARETLQAAYAYAPWATNETEQQNQLEQEMASMGCVMTCNHTVLGYEKVLTHGFEGLLAQVESHAPANAAFYAPLKIICEAGCELGDRYAACALQGIASAPTDARREELRHIAETCTQVPRRPARTFAEAVQSLWFAHMINTWEDNINANSLGRLDQILYPYYKADVEKGILTDEQAFELICLLWIKLYRDYDVQQSCIGGCDAQGNCAVNALSYLMLDATEALDFVRCLSVRYGAQTDKAFLERALQIVGRLQKGIPFFFNDDVMIPALTGSGIAYADATDYTQIGCVETVIPGKSNPHAVTARANLLKAVEYAFGNGHSLLNPALCPGIATGELAAFDTFEAFRDAVYAQARHIIENACRMTVTKIPMAAVNHPKPYKSLLTDDCVARGKDFNDQGARYDYYQLMLLGLPNVADSLAAVYELVYRRKLYTLQEVCEHLSNNFPDEAVRLDFLHKAPKFGNDQAEVDQMACHLLEAACGWIQECSDRWGYAFQPQPFTFLWMTDHGAHTAATPDGRRASEIIAYSASPMQGGDFSGFTALMNSLSGLPTKRTPGTTSAIVEVDPQLFTPENVPYFADILAAAGKKGLSNVQFNVVDADVLVDAQKHPERYRNLAVRVSGFSQKFYLLDKALQDHIISRTKHTQL